MLVEAAAGLEEEEEEKAAARLSLIFLRVGGKKYLLPNSYGYSIADQAAQLARSALLSRSSSSTYLVCVWAKHSSR